MKNIDAAVHHTIKNYNASSKSKQLWRLTPKNEARISKTIVQSKQEKHLMELMHKRDYYTNKIHEMLHSAAEVRDPAQIDDEKEAEFYIRKRIARSENAHQIRALVAKHHQFQQESEKRHHEIVARYAESSYGGLEKLASLQKKSRAEKAAQREKELRRLHREMATKQRELAKESEALLRVLKVPFFCSAPGHTASKVFVLNVLAREL